MAHSATVTSKGQITLPSRLRKALRLKAGDRITFIEDGSGDYRLEVRRHSLGDLRGIVKSNKPVTGDQIDAWIQEARAAGRYGSK